MEKESKNTTKRKTRIRISQLSCDWKDYISGGEIAKAIRLSKDGVGGGGYVYDYWQDEVDCKVMFVSSIELTSEQMDKLWKAGDLTMGDKSYWAGNDVDDICKQLRNKCKNEGEESEDSWTVTATLVLSVLKEINGKPINKDRAIEIAAEEVRESKPCDFDFDVTTEQGDCAEAKLAEELVQTFDPSAGKENKVVIRALRFWVKHLRMR